MGIHENNNKFMHTDDERKSKSKQKVVNKLGLQIDHPKQHHSDDDFKDMQTPKLGKPTTVQEKESEPEVKVATDDELKKLINGKKHFTETYSLAKDFQDIAEVITDLTVGQFFDEVFESEAPCGYLKLGP